MVSPAERDEFSTIARRASSETSKRMTPAVRIVDQLAGSTANPPVDVEESLVRAKFYVIEAAKTCTGLHGRRPANRWNIQLARVVPGTASA